ncbi:DUF1320 family protein [Sphingomonas sp. AR_OL41]|uniref:phage protein Gp36 family protein n=1 Tax=Sphingomonas sp. AR_OL41 TaxID=3042729 RepID=UPI00247FC449|nr:phage protein Gp36 family protein [Sphingomonas sp. AR_OL41]MDH7971777.1 DUF1320 family protein [Sphingomonas sp. AR_OL41]
MYATAEDMRTEYTEAALVQLADKADWASALPTINRAIENATVRADGHIAKYYARAAGRPVPPLLALIVREIAFADMHRSPTDEVAARRKAAIADLVKIANGVIKLDDGTEELPSRDGQIIVPDRERTFSRDRLAGF